MSYSIKILRRAQKELARLPRQELDQIEKRLRDLTTDPRPPGCKKLTGREGWRIRIGNNRVIYEVDDIEQTLTIMHVGHRRDVYH